MTNLHEPKPKEMDRTKLLFGRMLAVDLRSLSEAQMSALTQEAMRRCTSMPELLGELVDEVSAKLLGEAPKPNPHAA